MGISKMRVKLALFYCISFIFLAVNTLEASERGMSWYIAPVFSGLKGDSVRPSGNDTGVGLGFGIRFNEHWASELYGSGNTFYAPDGFSHFYQRSVSIDTFGFFLSRPRFELYGVVGLGGLRTTFLGEKTVNFMANAGLGFQVPIAKWGLALRSDIRYRYDNDRQSMSQVQKGFADWVWNIGLTLPFGGVVVIDSGKRLPAGDLLSQSNDGDNDGVADIIDLCKRTPIGVTVDSRGCEFDTDGDGVVDSRDHCANSLPNLHINAKGCEFDSDGDGLADSKDSCPDSTPGAIVDALGCEKESKRVIAKKTVSPKPYNVIFELDSAQLDGRARKQLSLLADRLKNAEDIRMIVTGHTDITGKVKHNELLAEQRAKAVTEYLIASGVPDEHIRIDARGPFSPIASNKTEEGRAKNRRVELYVMDN